MANILALVAFVQMAYGQSGTKIMDAFGAFENGRYTEAKQLFNELAKENSPLASKYYFYSGLADYRSADLTNATEEFKRANAAGNNNSMLWLAKVYSLTGDIANAIDYLRKYLNSEAATDIILIKKDPDFKNLHGSEEWFMLWQEENLRPEQIALSEARYHLDRKQFEQAHQILDDKISSGNASAELYSLGSEVYSSEGNQQLAIDEINRAINLKKKDAGYLFQKAVYLERSGRYDNAMELLDHVLEIAPENFAARYKRASLAFTTGNFDLAKTDLEIITKYFIQPEYSFLLGKTNYELGNYVAALKIFNHLMKNENPKAEYYKARGLTYYHTRYYDQAAYDLSMSLDLLPDDAETNLYLGLAERNKGNNTMACYYLNRAKEYGSTEAEGYIGKYCK